MEHCSGNLFWELKFFLSGDFHYLSFQCVISSVGILAGARNYCRSFKQKELCIENWVLTGPLGKRGVTAFPESPLSSTGSPGSCSPGLQQGWGLSWAAGAALRWKPAVWRPWLVRTGLLWLPGRKPASGHQDKVAAACQHTWSCCPAAATRSWCPLASISHQSTIEKCGKCLNF